MIGGNDGNLGYVDPSGWSWHTKNHFSFGYMPDANDPTGSNGFLLYQHSGKASSYRKMVISNKPIMFSGVTTAFDRIKFPGWFGNGDSSNFDAYYDDIYVAIGPNALARVELSDATDLKSSVLNVTLPVTTWSDTQIEVRVPAEYLDSVSSLFLRVYDSANNNISASLSSAPVANPPMPPVLTVNYN
ncbi:MAG: hypothetical protein V3T17_06690 [Pseudomonadales bacterium]